MRNKARFSAKQADGIDEVMRGDLATKTDLQSTQTDLRGGIQSVRTALGAEIQAVRSDRRETELRLETKIKAVTSDVITWVVGMIGFQTVVVIGAALMLARILTK